MKTSATNISSISVEIETMAETISEGVLYIPTPIITDILSRLPPNAVIRCRCVCKAWLKLISEPEFVNMHLSKSPTCLILLKFLFSLFQRPGFFFSFSPVEVEDETEHDGVRHIAGKYREIPLRQENSLTMIGSIDGLVCINEYNHYPHLYCDLIHVYNPIMGEFITVQPPPGGETASTYGFGISSGKYLVVRIYQETLTNPSPAVSLCHVYTIGGGGIWKSISHAPYQITYDRRQGLFFNGNLHWLNVWDRYDQEKMCCLDLEKEVFEPFPPPPELCEDNIATLNIYKGCLSVCDSTLETNIEIWVMKEYGVKNSWSKEVLINKDLIHNEFLYFDEFVYILKVFKDDDILLLWHNDDTLFTYDPKRKTMEDVKKSSIGSTNKDSYCHDVEATDYVPSIVSHKSLGEVNVYRS